MGFTSAFRSPIIIIMLLVITILALGVGLFFSYFESAYLSFTGKTNVDSVKNACLQQCESFRKTEYCEGEKKVIYRDLDDKRVTEIMNCEMVGLKFGAKCKVNCG